MSVLRSIIKPLRNNELVWRYGLNMRPSLGYRVDRQHALNENERSVLSDLNRDGIAVTSVDEILSEPMDFSRLNRAVNEILAQRKPEIEKLKSSASDAGSIGNKTFNMELLGSTQAVDASDIFCRFALDPAILNIANGYLRMFAKLRYYNVWYTFASEGPPRESQLWHFDREDNYILKVFVYLRDVDEGAGPFTYAPQTHRKGSRWGDLPEAFFENNVRRSTDDQMNAVVPRDSWKLATGKKGTVVFADTRGFHKGGEARTDDRLMFTCMFTSPASDSKQLLEYPSASAFDDLGLLQRRAVVIR